MSNTLSKYINIDIDLTYVYDSIGSFIEYMNTPQIEYNKEHIETAINNLRSTLTFLNDKINHMNEHTARYISEGKKLYRQNNKTGALHQIKLKKMYEKEIMKMESIKFNIETQILHMESVSVMVETVNTIKNTSGHIQLLNKNLDITKLETVIEDMCEQRDTSKDIESILSQSTFDEYDETELLRELEDSDEDSKSNQPNQTIKDDNDKKTLHFPEVPTNTLNGKPNPPPEPIRESSNRERIKQACT